MTGIALARIRRRRRPPRFTRMQKMLMVVLIISGAQMLVDYAQSGAMSSVVGASGSALALRGVTRLTDPFSALPSLLLALVLVLTGATMSLLGL